jgi:hypothetical protein
MKKMRCDQFEQILEQQEGEALPKPALAHIEECADCRALTLDFNAIHDVAMEMGAEGVAPPEYIWVALRNQLQAEGIIHDLRPAPQIARFGWWSAFQRPAVAGAFLSLILVAAATITYRQDFSQMAGHRQLALQQEVSAVPSAESIFQEEVRTVGSDSIPGFQKQDAAVADSFRRNLGIVDNFIVMCEKSVREQPDNEMAREYLYGAYQQKADLLATATSRTMTGGLQ